MMSISLRPKLGEAESGRASEHLGLLSITRLVSLGLAGEPKLACFGLIQRILSCSQPTVRLNKPYCQGQLGGLWRGLAASGEIVVISYPLLSQ
jgi:hypothetical protein